MDAIEQTRRWVEEVVVGLNLCPFARPILHAQTLRYVVCAEASWQAQRRFFLEELSFLVRQEPSKVSTSLLIFPFGLELFPVYLDFVSIAESLVEEAGLLGEVQVASFHPEYQFGGVAPEDRSHFTNRSPFPILHLLREEDVSRAVDGPVDTEAIPERNIDRLYSLTDEQWLNLFGRNSPSNS